MTLSKELQDWEERYERIRQANLGKVRIYVLRYVRDGAAPVQIAGWTPDGRRIDSRAWTQEQLLKLWTTFEQNLVGWTAIHQRMTANQRQSTLTLAMYAQLKSGLQLIMLPDDVERLMHLASGGEPQRPPMPEYHELLG